MDKEKSNILRRYGLSLAAICLCICIVMGVGISFARYRNDFLTTSFWFASAASEVIVMHGEVTDEQREAVNAGTWPETPASWSYSGSQAKLRFSVSNGESAERFASRDQAFSVELVTSLSVEDPEKLDVILTVPREDGTLVEYIGEAEELMEGTRYHTTYGDGWVYRFVDEEGNELSLPLKGGELRYTNCVLTVMGDTSSCLLSLELSGRYIDNE